MRILSIFSIAIISTILLSPNSHLAFAGVVGGESDPDADNVFTDDNCPYDYNPEQGDEDNDGKGDACDLEVTIEITSDLSDNLVVKKNQEVLISNGAIVSGNIEVKGGTLIISDGSTIEGNIESKKGGTIEISDSIIEGNVEGNGDSLTIKESTVIKGNVESKKEEAVIILDSNIDGNIEINKATSVTITGNSIDGDLEIKKTSGSCVDSGNNVDGSFDGCP